MMRHHGIEPWFVVSCFRALDSCKAVEMIFCLFQFYFINLEASNLF